MPAKITVKTVLCSFLRKLSRLKFAFRSGELQPKGPREGSYRVLRGGSWSDGAQYVRSASRSPDHPSERDSHYGFRVARGQG